MLTDFYWREARWLLLILLPLLIYLVRYIYQRRLWLKIADQHLLPWVKIESITGTNNSSRFWFFLAWFCFSIALAGPRTPQWIPPSLQSNDAVMVLVDLSTSMQARDTDINRIVQARRLLQLWLDKQSASLAGRLSMGLIVYSGHSHSLLIPTDDQTLFRHFINQLDEFKPPTRGNALAASLTSAIALLNRFTGRQTIILLTDGDLGEQALSAALAVTEQFKQTGIELSVIGLGKSEAVAIPVSGGQLFSVNGKIVVSHRETMHLQQLADSGNGNYYKAEVVKNDFTPLIDLSKPRIDAQLIQLVLWHEWFFIPLLLAMLFSFVALQRFNNKKKLLAATAMLGFLSACSHSDAPVMQDYTAAFSRGVDCYRAEDFICAQQSFAYAAWSVNDRDLRGRAVFNLANSHFKLGDYELASVLFQDAEYYGVDKSRTQINTEFADSLALAVKQRLKDIEKIRQHALWQSSAPELPEEFADMLVDGESLLQINKLLQSGLSAAQQQLLVQRGVRRKQFQANQQLPGSADYWVSSQQDKIAQQTSGLFNSLMPVESGLHYVPDNALEIEGVRSW